MLGQAGHIARYKGREELMRISALDDQQLILRQKAPDLFVPTNHFAGAAIEYFKPLKFVTIVDQVRNARRFAPSAILINEYARIGDALGGGGNLL
jgi:hypothetical protein